MNHLHHHFFIALKTTSEAFVSPQWCQKAPKSSPNGAILKTFWNFSCKRGHMRSTHACAVQTHFQGLWKVRFLVYFNMFFGAVSRYHSRATFCTPFADKMPKSHPKVARKSYKSSKRRPTVTQKLPTSRPTVIHKSLQRHHKDTQKPTITHTNRTQK